MFKKTVVAAAITLGMVGTASAFQISDDNIELQKVAIQSTQTVLQFQIGRGDAEFKIDEVLEELGSKDAVKADTPVYDSVFVRVELTGGAKWNLEMLKKAIDNKVDAAGNPVPEFTNFIKAYRHDNGQVSERELTKVFDFDNATLASGNVLRIPVKSARVEMVEGKVQKTDADGKPLYTNAAGAEVTDAVEADGSTPTTPIMIGSGSFVPQYDADFWGPDSSVNRFVLNFKQTGAFDLREATGTVKASVGLQTTDGSFTGEPKPTKNAFQLLDVYSVTQDRTQVSETQAKVANQFKSFDAEGKLLDTNLGTVTVENHTSDQPINKEVLKLKLAGDFSKVTKISASADTTEWSLNADKTAAFARISSNLEADKSVRLTLPTLTFSGKAAIPVMEYDFTAYMDSNATFNEYARGAEGAYVITHDGFTFDTVTTGTTAANTIYIRDISGKLPEAGGAINVTVWEYDAAGNSTELALAKTLTTKLPSKGAVTLSPADIAAELGIQVTPGNQARFLFEVETEKGEAAVKKQVAGVGVDIQTGTSGNIGVHATL